MKKVLFIGKIWPEPTSSAAGTRILQLINFFKAYNYEVLFASTASKTPYSYDFSETDIKDINIILNDDSFDEIITQLNPEIIIFDRFMTEEQFGWRVRQNLSNSITILDTEDLHFLRKARELAYKKNSEINLFTDEAKREIASILRCDLSLIISKAEMNVLLNDFKISEEKLFYLPFLENISNTQKITSTFEERTNFVFIGNYLHEPNYQTVLRLKKNIWPTLSKLLPDAELHIYGAYSPNKLLQLNNDKDKFLIKGRAIDVQETLSQYKLLIAPIPFGAGLKGKFIDAIISKTPSVTTSIGAEGMQFEDVWSGFITDSDTDFIDLSEKLYTNRNLWEEAISNGELIIQNLFNKDLFYTKFLERISKLQNNIEHFRNINFIGEILKTNQLNSMKYMSLWIQEKNKIHE